MQTASSSIREGLENRATNLQVAAAEALTIKMNHRVSRTRHETRLCKVAKQLQQVYSEGNESPHDFNCASVPRHFRIGRVLSLCRRFRCWAPLASSGLLAVARETRRVAKAIPLYFIHVLSCHIGGRKSLYFCGSRNIIQAGPTVFSPVAILTCDWRPSDAAQRAWASAQWSTIQH